MELQLIELYLWVCSIYDNHRMLKYQRLTNNWQPVFTDQELITIYLFAHLRGQFTQKLMYVYIAQHFAEWFPNLPTYQAFNRSLNQLAEPFKILVLESMKILFDENDFRAEQECVID